MTDIEEKKIDEVEEESDFADEIKTAAEPAPAPVEEPKPEDTIDLHSEEAEEEEAPAPTPAPDKKGKITIEYPDESLGKVELARQEFYKVYHKSNIIKWIVTGFCILLIICGWLIPNAIDVKEIKENSMIIALIACGVGLVGLLVFNFFWKKNVQTAMNRYFREYYEHTNAYVFQYVNNIEGSIDNKIEDDELRNCNLYKDIGKVGSRATYTFDYHEKTIKVCDAAAQVVLGKTLRTVFVGKYLYTTNSYKGSDILIYFKGNKRALPPTNLAARKVFSDSKNIVIYGDKGTEKVITPKVREALNEFKTNKTFVDMAIAIREGTTYFAMGYEDDLMIIALEKPFDPNPTVQYAGDLKKVLKLIDLMK